MGIHKNLKSKGIEDKGRKEIGFVISKVIDPKNANV